MVAELLQNVYKIELLQIYYDGFVIEFWNCVRIFTKRMYNKVLELL